MPLHAHPAKHPAPAGFRRRHTEAEENSRKPHQDHKRHVHSGKRMMNRRHNVRQNMLGKITLGVESPRATAETDINIFFYADNQAAHHSRGLPMPFEKLPSKNYLPQTRFDQRDDYHQQQQIKGCSSHRRPPNRCSNLQVRIYRPI